MNDNKLRRPVIGISPSIGEGKIKMNTAYCNAIFAAGGVPVFLPYTADPERLERYAELDGFLFAGGVDVDPKYYGKTVSADNVETDAARDEFEFALFRRIYPTGKPIFGICRGMQLINVALGGTLYQDIPGHRQTEAGKHPTQTVKIAGDGRLSRMFGAEAEVCVNTFHHQAVKDVADTLSVSARAEDGIVEAVETCERGRYLAAVQWHPELLAEEHAAHAALFETFISEAIAWEKK